jgi:hypothetical protein
VKQIATIGLDLAKQVFQVHGAEADASPVVSRKLRRTDVLGFFEKLLPCLVGMEACGGAYFGARAWKRAAAVTLQRRFVSASWRGQREAKIAVPA